MRCRRCNGTGRVVLREGFRVLEAQCPNCKGLGRVLAGMQGAASSDTADMGDVLLFCVTTALVWAFASSFTRVAFYCAPNGGLALHLGGRYQLSLLRKIVTGWGIVGLVLGWIMLRDFPKLASKLGPGVAFGIHLMRMSVVALGLGALLGRSSLYSELPPVVGMILLPVLWRTVISSVIAWVATVVSMRVIPKIMRLIEQA